MSGDRVERRLMAVLAADVAGYSRLVGADEEGTLAQWKAHWRAVVDPKVTSHHGRIVRIAGDGILVEFASVVDAVTCAVDVQRGMAEQNAVVPQDKRIEFRIGINVGDLIIDGNDIWGDGVNVASRLESLAEPGGIAVSARVLEDVQGKIDVGFEDVGERQLKNIARPVRVYFVRLGEGGTAMLTAPALPEKPSVAVLPFQNLSGDPEQEYFADGMVEEIITALSRMKWLFVIARNSTFTYKGRAVDLKQVGRELGVRYVLEGSVRKSANRVRVTAQLIDAVGGHHVWAERYDRELADIFAVQDEITQTVMEAIEPQLYAAEGMRVRRKPTESLDAWESVIRALSHINARTQADAEGARTLLSRAVAIDPGYAQAHSLLAFITALSVQLGWAPREPTLTRASEAAQKALALDPDEPWAHAGRGFVLVLRRRPEEAVREYEKALALNPSFAFVHTMLGAAACYLGRSEQAMEHIDHAERLSPRDLLSRGNLGANNVIRAAASLVAERYDEGLTFAEKAVSESPSSTPAHRQLVINCALAGKLDEAKAALEKLRNLHPEISLRWVEDWLPFVRAEDRQKYLEGFRLAGLD
ncbi:MAG TPA: adenylate/guanylate cyclase domain-containing protein [Xanthobacteraceae bacterium]